VRIDAVISKGNAAHDNQRMTSPVTSSFDGAARLSDWGAISASGADAATFLQGQLTQDVASLDAGRATLAGYCSPKGRLLASFVLLRPAREEFLLLCSADLLAATLKRLSMYVLRAKCKLADASALWPLHGVAGEAAMVASAPWRTAGAQGNLWVRLPDAQGTPRALALHAPALPPLEASAWAWLEAASGVPRIVAATAEQFVPQMVNLELVGGVDFQKGCYPGQEIVARSQYRGTLKRRAFGFDSPQAAQPGMEIFHSADPAQPAGMVANAGSYGDRHRLLAELKIAALDGGSLHLGAADGARLTRAELPYAVPLEAAA
jgi:tRNA-modifying protein YgfZ